MNEGFGTGFMMGMCIAALAGLASLRGCDSSWKNEAVKQGHAEYFLSPEHQRVWRWLPTHTTKHLEK